MNVELNDGAIIDLARRDAAFPLHDPRHANAAFPCLRFEARNGPLPDVICAVGPPLSLMKKIKCFLPARARIFASSDRVVHGGASRRRCGAACPRSSEAREIFSRDSSGAWTALNGR